MTIQSWANTAAETACMLKFDPDITRRVFPMTSQNSSKIVKNVNSAKPQRAFDIMIIDTRGTLLKSNSGNRFAITLMFDLTKHLTTIPVKNKDAKTVAKAIMENFLLIFGPMKQIRTNCGTEYKNSELAELCSLLDISRDFSTPYHHETVGTIERNHRVLNEYLRAYLEGNHDLWDQYAKYFAFCYNTTPNTAFITNSSHMS